MEEKIVNIWLSVRPSKRHPILIYKLQSGQRITVTLPTLYNDNPEDVAVAQEIYDRKRRQIALGMLDDAAEIAGMRADLPLHEFERKFMAHRNQLAARCKQTPDNSNKNELSGDAKIIFPVFFGLFRCLLVSDRCQRFRLIAPKALLML